jgi:phage terminase small subunit
MTSKYLLPTEDEDELGPKMAICSKQERLFVRALFAHPGHGAGARAARLAGYGNANSPNVTFWRAANRLFNRERVADAIAEMTRLMMRSAAPQAVQAVNEIIKDKSHKDRLKAARTVIERADPVEQRISADIHHTITDRRDRDTDTLKYLRHLKDAGVNRDALVKIFGFSGLPIYEQKLAALELEQAGKSGAPLAAVIEGEFTELARSPVPADADDDEEAEA